MRTQGREGGEGEVGKRRKTTSIVYCGENGESEEGREREWVVLPFDCLGKLTKPHTISYPPNTRAYAYAALEWEMLSSNAAVNPSLFNWNVVFVRYCDGGLWSAETMATEQVREAGREGSEGREGRERKDMSKHTQKTHKHSISPFSDEFVSF